MKSFENGLNVSGYGEKRRGLSVNQLKWIALITMTIDHLAAYGFVIPVFNTYYDYLRIIGRIAAPLFFFVLTESIRHTRSKAKLLLRLYLGAVGVGLFVAVTNLFFHDTIGRFSQSNILFDYVYTTIYILLIEQIFEGIKQKRWSRGGLAFLGILATCIPHYIGVWLLEFPYAKFHLAPETVWTIQDFVGSFVRSPLQAEYTILFILMGILMYFAGNKFGKAAVIVLFSAICYVGGKIPFLPMLPIQTVLGYPQYYMVLAVPFVLLYNGEKGKSCKYFFYLYYPLHRYAISVLVYVYSILVK